ncbi:MAG: 4Fe-4S ferredoxin, partial [Oscillospiraceae bacterium]|nr:4Fe-4S ferredoxin [Oscillospiraceae bacterium]
MKRVYVNEDRCLGCHLCEYYCAFANSGESDMAKTFKLDKNPVPRITVEELDGISFAVQCRQWAAHPCVTSCITGALSFDEGISRIDESRCVGCYT